MDSLNTYKEVWMLAKSDGNVIAFAFSESQLIDDAFRLGLSGDIVCREMRLAVIYYMAKSIANKQAQQALN